MQREVLSSQSRRLVLNVIEYFQNKKETTSENVSVIKCASDALKLSERTISRIRKEGVVVRPRNRIASKTKDLTEEQKHRIREVVHNMIEQKQYITRENLRQELINREIMIISKSSLSVVLKNLGFHYITDNGKGVWVERIKKEVT